LHMSFIHDNFYKIFRKQIIVITISQVFKRKRERMSLKEWRHNLNDNFADIINANEQGKAKNVI
jgi:hypothetical protein